MSDLDSRIEGWKKSLLDLGKGNRLLNYHDTKKSNIKIIEPEIEELYLQLVLEEKELKFPHTRNNGGKAEQGDIKTNKTTGEQQTLKNLRDKAKTALEEQGVNILYLSFGFLEWTEMNESKQTMVSPLVLVPVTLKLETFHSPYVLKLHEDEIVMNPTLAYKMEHEFGILFPEIEPNEISIVDYLESIQEKVNHNGWKVLKECGLSLFSFLKMNMYADLEQHKNRIINNPVLKALAGDAGEIRNVSEELIRFDHDNNMRPVEVFQVVDADSSQQDAILYSKNGISFVLQGPPGTGKSQTITNVIAEALADGKKVLFVSEKMAALEVVQKRLTQAGLSDFCLMLHSYKANKKDVLYELNKTLNMERIKLKEDAIYQLDALQKQRETLNQYAKELHEPCPPLNKSIYEIIGKLSKLTDVPDVVFELQNIGQTTLAELHEARFLLCEYSYIMDKMALNYKENPWQGVFMKQISLTDRRIIEKNMKDLYLHLQKLKNRALELTIQYGIGTDITIEGIKALIAMFDLVGQSAKIPVGWVMEPDLTELFERAEKYSVLRKEYQECRKLVEKKFRTEVYLRNASLMMHELEQIENRVNECINRENYPSLQKVGKEKERILSILEKADKAFEFIEEDIAFLEQLGLAGDVSLIGLKKVSRILELLSLDLKPTNLWFDETTFESNLKFSKLLKNKFYAIDVEKEALFSEYDKQILAIDYLSIWKRYRTDYVSFTKALYKQYRKDKRVIRSLKLSIHKKFDDDMVLSAVNRVKEIADKQNWIKGKQKRAEEFLGVYYEKENTNWNKVNRALEAFCEVKKACGPVFPKNLKEKMLDGSLDSEKCQEVKQRLQKMLSEGFKQSLAYIVERNNLIEKESVKVIRSRVIGILCCLKEFDETLTRILFFTKDRLSYNELVSGIQSIMKIQQMESEAALKEEEIKTRFFSEYQGFDTDWDFVTRKLEWTTEFIKFKDIFSLSGEFIIKSCEDDNFIRECLKSSSELGGLLNQTTKGFQWFKDLFENGKMFENQEISAVMERVYACGNNLSALEEWTDYCNCWDKCIESGMTEYLEEFNKMGIDNCYIVDAYLKRFYQCWLDTMITKHSAVVSFRRRNRESAIEEFQKLDLMQLNIARVRIRERLLTHLPDVSKTSIVSDEIALLKRECNKQQKVMPLRKLFKSIPNLLMTLKPCMMMSPLSVSLFLQADSYDFDLVVFDEASQIHTEDAIGAIMRGKQVIIAGDSKQLPPTSFFTTTTSNSSLDAENPEKGSENYYESILDEAGTVLPELILKWHYRSRNESLIAFSNANIYNYSLITFPSTMEKVLNTGVEYIYVNNGVYDRGGTKCNQEEAKKVAELVFEHILHSKNRSLGVITFSEAQLGAVESAVRKKRMEHPELEEFFDEDKVEGFFIKNLENVQGDERDTIIFSIGYAKDTNGVMLMSFGPLSRDGGYRRLNVAITRAKFNIKLVGSIQPLDIKLENTNSEGIRMLRAYIEYAVQGQKMQGSNFRSYEIVNNTPFEDAIYDFLIKNNYRVATKVGCSGYRIDLAVKHPTLSGRYVLGIECDGATYYNARTARERDRLRQGVLEDIGWKMYRVWSADWIKDPITEGKRLINAIEEAVSTYVDDSLLAPVECTEAAIEGAEDFEIPTEEQIQKEIVTYSFQEYVEADIWAVDKDCEGNDYIGKVIDYVVAVESPIHFELLCKRVAPVFGYQKTTAKVRSSVQYMIENHTNKVFRQGDFCWTKEKQELSARVPTEFCTRAIHLIAPEEIAQAMYAVLQKESLMQRDELFVTTAKIFGFHRIRDNIQVAMTQALKILEDINYVRFEEDNVILDYNCEGEVQE